MKAIALFAVLLYLMFTTSGTSHADPVNLGHNASLVCKWLTYTGSEPWSFQAMIKDMMSNGLSDQETADAITYAVTNTCPWFYDDAQAAIDYYKVDTNLRKHAV